MKKLIIAIACLFSASVNAQFLGDGNDGAFTSSGANSFITDMGGQYTYGTADISAGATSVAVNSITGFAQCDLVLIIQMDGANAGLYDLSRIASVAGNTITLSTATNNAYTNANKIQVVKIPEFTNVTISGGHSITTTAWNGTTGGIVWFYATGTADISGTINVNGLGFTGGAGNTSGGTGSSGIARGASGTNGSCGANNNGEDAGDAGGGAKGTGGSGGSDCNGGNGGRGSNQGNAGGVGGSGAAGNGPAGGVANGGGAGANNSISDTKFIMGSGGGGGKAGNGGRGGGGGGGGGANTTWTGHPGVRGDDGGNATADCDGGNGGTGGGIIVVYANSISGAGTVTANATNGSNGTGTGGTGGNGGAGGDAGDSDCSGSNDISAGGGGGGGDGGNGGDGSGGGGGGSGGVIRLGGTSNTFSGTATISAGAFGTGGAAGAAGAAGAGGSKGSNGACVGNASNGSDGTAGSVGATGASGTTGNAGLSVSNTTVPNTSIVTCDAILPIELISFSAKAKTKTVELKWITASEHNNDYFTIEKTNDGKNFSEVMVVDGAGNSNATIHYSTTDDAPYEGLSYYRLKQTDHDGRFSYSGLHAVNFEKPDQLNIFSNPAYHNTLYIRMDGSLNECQLKIFNSMGQLVYVKNLKQEEDSMLITVNLENHFTPGVYSVMLFDKNKFFQKKILIQ